MKTEYYNMRPPAHNHAVCREKITDKQGIWQNGMYIPPELVEQYIQTLEGMPVRLDKSDQIVGHITNVRQIGSSISMDIEKTPTIEKDLKELERVMKPSISFTREEAEE